MILLSNYSNLGCQIENTKPICIFDLKTDFEFEIGITKLDSSTSTGNLADIVPRCSNVEQDPFTMGEDVTENVTVIERPAKGGEIE